MHANSLNSLYRTILFILLVSIDGVPKKREVTGPTEAQLYGSSWETHH